MSEPVVAQSFPYAIELEPGKYWWCACGRSANQPFCDGSHSATGLAPVPFELADATKVWLCGCKKTGTAPMCDGAHKNL
jgi:CDGSH-type Zn-finger protein